MAADRHHHQLAVFNSCTWGTADVKMGFLARRVKAASPVAVG